jgi:aspartate/methionine/tyrosine aminotransferase
VDGSGSIVTERLAVAAFGQVDRLIARANAILEANRRIVRAFLDQHEELATVESVGTVIFPRLQGVVDAGPFVDRLRDEFETAVVPGRFFEAPSHFRVGFGGPTATVEQGLARLSAALKGDSPPS